MLFSGVVIFLSQTMPPQTIPIVLDACRFDVVLQARLCESLAHETRFDERT